MHQLPDHQPALRHLYIPGAAYLITFATHKRQPLFETDVDKDLIITDFDFYRNKFRYALYAFAILPDHTHWVICPSEDDFERFRRQQINGGRKYARSPEAFYLSKIMEDMKRHISFALNQRYDTRGRQVWQKGFHDRMIRDNDALYAAVEYLHNNAVKAGLVAHPADYRYSSYRNIYLGDDRLIKLDPLPL